MFIKYFIIVIIGFFGVGISMVMQSFQYIFCCEGLKVQIVEGDFFYCYDCLVMWVMMKEQEVFGNCNFSYFGLEVNLLEELQ